MAVKFGTSGLRGLATDLIGPVSAVYATAFARFLLDGGHARPGSQVLVGQDFRPSSPEIAATCMAALARTGLVPVHCGTVPTPALALFGQKIGAASLMVTGSHIPADRNGIKFYRPDGEIDKDDEQALTRLAQALATNPGANLVESGTGEDRKAETLALFAARYARLLAADRFHGLRIGVYQHSSVARDLIVALLQGFGAEIIALGRSDRFIPVDTEAVSNETRRLLAAWANEHRLDAIVSTDGDADRPLVTDAAGEPLGGDLLGLMAAQWVKASVIVTPVTSNSGLERVTGATVVRTRVGSPYVVAAMQSEIAAGQPRVIGFEANGGTLLASDVEIDGMTLTALPTRDCILPILAALTTAAAARAPLATVVGRYALPFARADRLENIPLERSAALMAEFGQSPEALAGFLAPLGRLKASNRIDGLRLTLSDDSILHLRPSGNAPEMRCYVEARSADGAEDLLRRALERLRTWLD